jgi:hypothetical protein
MEDIREWKPISELPEEEGKLFLLDCGHCGKQHPVPLKNRCILGYMCNTNCTFCGSPLAKFEIS